MMSAPGGQREGSCGEPQPISTEEQWDRELWDKPEEEGPIPGGSLDPDFSHGHVLDIPIYTGDRKDSGPLEGSA